MTSPPPLLKVPIPKSPGTSILPCPKGYFPVLILTTSCFFKDYLFISKTLFCPGFLPASLFTPNVMLYLPPNFEKLRFFTSTGFLFFSMCFPRRIFSISMDLGTGFMLMSYKFIFPTLTFPLSFRLTYLIACLIPSFE